MGPGSTPRARAVATLLVAAAVGGFAAWCAVGAAGHDFPYDDAYIVLHNARSLLAGRDASYAGASPLHGATSAAHLALVAGLARWLSPGWASFTVAALAAVAYGAGAVRLALAHGWRATGAVAFGGLALTVAEVPHQLDNGLETGLALAALTWSLTAQVAAGEGRLPRWSLVLAGALPAVRPELAAVTLLTAAGVVTRPRATRGEALRDLAWMALGGLPWALWYARETGLPWPLTVRAKRAFFAEECQPWRFRLRRAAAGLGAFGARVGMLAAAWPLLARERVGRAAMAFSLGLATLYFARMPSAFDLYEGRYLYVLVPLLLHATAATAASPRRWLRAVGAGLVAVAIAQSAPRVVTRWRSHADYSRTRAEEYRAVIGWCRAHLPAGAAVLLHDAGFLADAGGFALTDLVGLKTPASVSVNDVHIRGGCRRDRAAATVRIATAARARHLLALRDWDEDYYHFTAALRAAGWRVTRVYESPRAIYRVFALTPP